MTLRRRCLIGLIILCILGGSARSRAVAPPLALPPTSQPQVTSTDDGLILEWRAPDARVAPREDGAWSVVLPGYSKSSRPGAPELPFASTWIALPPGATPTLRVLVAQETERPLPGPLALAPVPQGVRYDATGRPIGGEFTPATSAAQPVEGDEWSVDGPVVLEPAGLVRGVHLVRAVFYPVRPEGERLRITTYLRASITFGAANMGAATIGAATIGATAPPVSQSLRQATDPILAALRSAVINPEHVRSPATTVNSPQLQARTLTDPGAVAIEVDTPGLTAITYEALSQMGYSVGSTDPHTLHLAHSGNRVAVEWNGDDDTIFEPGERLLFYAGPHSSRWSSTNVYLLWRDATPGLRMSSRSADPTGQPTGIAWTEATAEVNALYTPDCFCGTIPAGRDGDHWVWDALDRVRRPAGLYSIHTPAVDAAQPATVTLWFIGYTSLPAAPDHRVDITLNGAFVGRAEWDGKAAITATLSVPAGALRSGNNTVGLSLPGIPGVSVENMWLDAFTVRYARGQEPVGASVGFGQTLSGSTSPSSTLPHRLFLPLVMRDFPGRRLAYTAALASPGPYLAYDVTDPRHPQRLTGVRVDGNTVTLSDPMGGAPGRYWVTAWDGIRSPARLRAVEDVWSLNATGPSTGADYIVITHPAFADALDPLVSLRQSQGLLTAVVNVLGIYDAWGDGRLDPQAIRAFIANAYATWNPRPTFVLLVGDGSFDPKGYWSGSTPTFVPPYLADVDPWAGEAAADNRYVAVDGNDALPDMLIGRLPVKTPAEARTVIDKIVRYEKQPLPGGWNADVVLAADDPDGAGDFVAESEFVATQYIAAPFVPQRIYYAPPASAESTRLAVLNRWKAGALIVQFTGHSSWQQWAAERLFHLDDLAALHNEPRWPIVVEMTCFTSAFHRPEPTLDEELLTHIGGGAVATWGATGLGVGAGHHELGEGFYQAVFRTPVDTLGEAALAGKLSLAATHWNLDLLDTFTLLGDPALLFNRTVLPWTAHLYLPLVSRSAATGH